MTRGEKKVRRGGKRQIGTGKKHSKENLVGQGCTFDVTGTPKFDTNPAKSLICRVRSDADLVLSGLT